MSGVDIFFIDDSIGKVLSVPFCPYYFVFTIVSNTILSVPFCPLPFCPRTVHTIAKKCSTGTTSKYSPICPKFCTQSYPFMCNKGSLVEPCISNFWFFGPHYWILT